MRHDDLAKLINFACLNTEKADMQSSAVYCASMAISLTPENKEAAKMWAMKSLLYSLGAFHPVYQKCLNNDFSSWEASVPASQ